MVCNKAFERLSEKNVDAEMCREYAENLQLWVLEQQSRRLEEYNRVKMLFTGVPLRRHGALLDCILLDTNGFKH